MKMNHFQAPKKQTQFKANFFKGPAKRGGFLLALNRTMVNNS